LAHDTIAGIVEPTGELAGLPFPINTQMLRHGTGYPKANRGDGGGSNSSRYYIFKQDLQALVNELGIEIRIAHYPLYTSKYNPIKHRLFPHISRVCQGVIFESVQTVKDLMATATTRTGLKMLTTILDKTHQTGRKVAEDFKSNMKIVFDEFLPQWNYTAKPELQVI